MITKIAILAIAIILTCSFLIAEQEQTVIFRVPVVGGGDGVTVKLYKREGNPPYVWSYQGLMGYKGSNPGGTVNYYEKQKNATTGVYKVTGSWSDGSNQIYNEVTQQLTVYQYYWTFPYLVVLPPQAPDPGIPGED